MISDNVSAYNFYHQHYDYDAFTDCDNPRPKYLDEASLSQLAILCRDDSVMLRSKANDYYHGNGKLPSVSASRCYKAGFFTDNFKPLSSLRTEISIGDQSSDSSAVDVKLVREPTISAEELLAPTQSQLVDQLISIVQAMNLDEI